MSAESELFEPESLEHLATAKYETLELTRTMTSPGRSVWAVIRDFGNMSWVPGGPESTTHDGGPGVGLSRIIDVPGCGPVRETLVALSDTERTLTYTVSRNMPFPVNYYCATMRVSAEGAGETSVVWSCVFEPEGVPAAEAAAAIEKLYNVMLDWIDNSASRLPSSAGSPSRER